MSGDAEKDRAATGAEEQVELPTRAYFEYLRADMRDREIEHVTSTYLAHAPNLRDLLPLIKNLTLKHDIEELLRVYDDLEVLNNFEKGSRLLAEFMLSRAVDNFECYMAEVLAIVFHARPETLRSFDKVKMEDVLACASMDEFVSRTADRKAEELSYGGVSKMTKFMEDELRLTIDERENCIPKATEAIAVRNVVVHNRGKANGHFLQVTGRTDLKAGDLVPIDLESAEMWRASLDAYAELINNAVMTKFGKDIYKPDSK
jgi:hypothetical protein